MFTKKRSEFNGRDCIIVSGLGSYSIEDTFECGQCFRHELILKTENYIEYMTVIGENLIFVGQKTPGEIIFFDTCDELFEKVINPYFTLETDYQKIKNDIISHTDSKWLISAAESAKGIAILKQEPWEALFSFIISQNNNIPRIKKIIKRISAEYGVNICLLKNRAACPLSKTTSHPCEEICRECGACYTFPSAEKVVENPEKLLKSNPGFRYKYLLDAAEKVASGEVNLEMISSARSYEYTKASLEKIKGVGEKVASCTALFGFANLEAFPIDVWMKRAIDDYFNGELSPESLGRYAGVAQQYIFHYIRNLQNK